MLFIWVMKITSRYKFSEEEIKAVKQIRKGHKDKCAGARLKALELRAKRAVAKKASEATGFHAAYVTHSWQNIENMGLKQSQAVIMAAISEIAKAYQCAMDHPVSRGRIYFVLHRHGWRKVMPRSKRPGKASDKEIAASKKLTLLSRT